MKLKHSIVLLGLCLPQASKANAVSLSEIIDQIPSGEAMTTAPFEDFSENHKSFELAGGKSTRKLFKSKPKPVAKISIGNRTYPLKLYEPLSDMIQKTYGHGLTVTKGLEPAVNFWRNVYARYDLNKTILHDNWNLGIIYGVLDFSNLDDDVTLQGSQRRAIRATIEEEKKDELRQMLLRFQRGETPQTVGEQIVYGLFEKVDESDKFLEAATRIRSQWGQKDRFMAGMIRAGRYMPMMEEIFIRAGAPKEITRLVFVESMFNLNAFSKAGAAGPWQFMPGTAKLYMTINDIVDERRDPLIAAEGATRLLMKNYELAGSWPLAINGYNTGILRMIRARDRHGTHDIATIIQKFSDPGYQFASRNFFPEFMAALEVANHPAEYFGEFENDVPVPFDEVILPYNSSFKELADATVTDVGVLRDLNPAYYEKNFGGKSFIPKGYTIRVPYRQKMLFLAALDQMHNLASATRWHIAGKNESLKTIAARYQVALKDLKETNGLIDNRVDKGQLLKIPSEPKAIVLEIH